MAARKNARAAPLLATAILVLEGIPMKKTLYLFSAVSLLITLLLISGAAAPQGASGSSGKRVTLLVMLGVNSSAPERWDGDIEVTNGRIVAIEGRHFSGLDKITGPNSWASTNRRDEVGGRPERLWDGLRA